VLSFNKHEDSRIKGVIVWALLIIRVKIRAVEPDFKKSNKKPDAKVGYRRLYPTLHSIIAADVLAG